MLLYGKSRDVITFRNSCPTAPVTPTIARDGASCFRLIRTDKLGLVLGLICLEDEKNVVVQGF